MVIANTNNFRVNKANPIQHIASGREGGYLMTT